MQNELPFYESPENALRACVKALGGAKKVGSSLFPDKTIDNARDYLLACLNSERAEKLNVSQVMFIFREAKNIGFHSAFDWFSRECEYEARPVSPEEKRDRLADAIETASRVLEMAVKEAHQMTNPVKRVA